MGMGIPGHGGIGVIQLNHYCRRPALELWIQSDPDFCLGIKIAAIQTKGSRVMRDNLAKGGIRSQNPGARI
jgi:hypothetical protein